MSLSILFGFILLILDSFPATNTVSGTDGYEGEYAYYLVGGDAQKFSDVKTSIKQENKKFVPDILSVSTNATVTFPNRDKVAHNVYSVEGPMGFFDLGVSTSDQEKTLQMVISKNGATKITCAMHPIMKAIIFTVPSKYSDASRNGRYEIKNVPSGTYDLMMMNNKGLEKKLKTIVVN